MKPHRVLITDYVDRLLVEGLRRLGYHVVYAPEAEQAEAVDWLPDFSGIIVNTRIPIDGAVMKGNPQLRFIGRLGVGLDIFDEETARELRIHLLNTPGANANAVGEHCMGMLLALLRNIPAAHTDVMSGYWPRERHRGAELAGKTIGIIGFGNTGRAFASKLGGWMTRVVSYDKYKEHYAGDLRFVEEVDLETVLAEADVLSLHVPLTGETEGMVDKGFLQKCREGLILINSSRGKVVDTAALLSALQDGKVYGACLDVLENENPATFTQEEQSMYHALFHHPRVILTPHIAGWTYAAKRRIAKQILDRIEAVNVDH